MSAIEPEVCRTIGETAVLVDGQLRKMRAVYNRYSGDYALIIEVCFHDAHNQPAWRRSSGISWSDRHLFLIECVLGVLGLDAHSAQRPDVFSAQTRGNNVQRAEIWDFPGSCRTTLLKAADRYKYDCHTVIAERERRDARDKPTFVVPETEMIEEILVRTIVAVHLDRDPGMPRTEDWMAEKLKR